MSHEYSDFNSNFEVIFATVISRLIHLNDEYNVRIMGDIPTGFVLQTQILFILLNFSVLLIVNLILQLFSFAVFRLQNFRDSTSRQL